MDLKELIENFEAQTKVKIVENDEILFEGSVEVLEKLFRAKVKKHGCNKTEECMVVNIAQYV